MNTPRELGLPYDTWRSGQRWAIRTCLHPKTTHIVINAPTGAGKSTIAAALPRLQPDRHHVTLTATRALQDQYSGTFPFLCDLRGASNYQCLAAMDELKSWFPRRRIGTVHCGDGPCHDGITCSLQSDGCRYFDARRRFIGSTSGLTNYAAWFANRRWAGGLGTPDRLICDEAHALPEQLMQACAIDIGHHLFDSRRVPRTVADWSRWASEKIQEMALGSDDDQRLRRSQTERVLQQVVQMDRSWAWDMTSDGYHFEPTIPRLLLPLLHKPDDTSHVIYLSATITPATLRLLDIPDDDVTFETLPSVFPLDRRPIYIVPGARVDFRSMKQPHLVSQWLRAMDLIMEDRMDRRGLIHPVSFDRSRAIYMASSQRGRMILHERRESAASVVQRFRQAGPSAILVSPSIMTGFDFAYESAEFQIVAKLPFPDTRSPIMRSRVKATVGYRDHITMTNLVQACGRINRADDDSGETFIVDEHFRWWYRQASRLSPDWFDDALVWTRRRVLPLPKLARVAA